MNMGRSSRSEPGWGVCHPCLGPTKTSKGAKDPNVAKGLRNGVVNQGETRAGVMAKGHQQSMVTQSCLFKGPGGLVMVV